MASLRSAPTRFGVLTAAALAALVLIAQPPPPAAAQEANGLVETEISFSGADRTIGGTVIAPEGEDGLPGLVLVSGSGPGPERDRYRAHAEAFAEAGIAVLLYDKRGADEGYSLTSASIEDLADDAIAAVEALRARPEADADLVGLHGHSEGAWVVIEAAARSAAPAFVVTSGGSALPPEATQAWMNRDQLRRQGVADPLLEPLGDKLIGALVADGLFRLAGYDPLPALAELQRPFLGVFAEHDLNTPPARSLELYEETLRASGNPNYSLRVVPGVDHEMVPSEDGTQGADHDRTAIDLSPGGYVDTVAEWVRGIAAGAVGIEVDPVPEQALGATALSEAPWFGTAETLLAALGLFTLLFGAYPVAALVRRLRRRGPLEASWASRTVSVVGLLLPPLVFLYVAWVLMSGGMEVLGPVIAGRPLPWLLLEVAAVALVVSGLALAVQAWRRRARLDRASRLRFAALFTGLVVLIPWGAYWGLLALGISAGAALTGRARGTGRSKGGCRRRRVRAAPRAEAAEQPRKGSERHGPAVASPCIPGLLWKRSNWRATYSVSRTKRRLSPAARPRGSSGGDLPEVAVRVGEVGGVDSAAARRCGGRQDLGRLVRGRGPVFEDEPAGLLPRRVHARVLGEVRDPHEAEPGGAGHECEVHELVAVVTVHDKAELLVERLGGLGIRDGE